MLGQQADEEMEQQLREVQVRQAGSRAQSSASQGGLCGGGAPPAAAAATNRSARPRARPPQEVFSLFDSDGSGQLSASEVGAGRASACARR